MAERLRLSELDAWRYLTPEDPFDELVYMWLNDLGWLSDASEAACELWRRIVRTQLTPAFGDLTIGEITAERIEHHLAIQRATSEGAAAYSREAIELLLNFAVGEGVIISNPMGFAARDETPGRLGDLGAHRNLVRGRIALRREDPCAKPASHTTEVVGAQLGAVTTEAGRAEDAELGLASSEPDAGGQGFESPQVHQNSR
ncbi:hypothetical protein ACPW96_08495 [Micromonospora sp. DT81.3]|uniref:hypothetical protein n=1 Tax=Micromonospora sp. DT81.3 TaxID=3416523 RepID=UPI003CF56A5E